MFFRRLQIYACRYIVRDISLRALTKKRMRFRKSNKEFHSRGVISEVIDSRIGAVIKDRITDICVRE